MPRAPSVSASHSEIRLEVDSEIGRGGHLQVPYLRVVFAVGRLVELDEDVDRSF